MAKRRMFSLQVVDSDAFLDMPLSAQMLYIHLGMRADDDGFVNSPRRIQRMIGASDDDFRLLLAKKFIISFESGIVVIKHWKMNNYIRNDRYTETDYLEEKAMLEEKKNGSYSLYTVGIPNGYQMDTQVRIGKSKDIHSHSLGRFGNVTLSDFERDSLEIETDKETVSEYIEKLSIHKESTGATYESDYATLIKWLTDDGLIQ